MQWDNGIEDESKITGLQAGTYCLRVIDSKDCEETMCFRVPSTTDTSDPEAIDFTFYPNPTSHAIYWHSNQQIKSITLYSTDGSVLVTELSPTDKVISLPTSYTGIFLIRIESEKGIEYRKGIKI